MSDYSIAIKIAGQLEGSFKQALKGAQNGLSGLGAAGKIGGAAVKATAATITTAGAAIGAVGAYSANVGKDFESAMSSVAATADASAEEYTKLENAAREMGRTTSKTAAESANALEYMSLAGWDVDKSISALPSVLRLSEASGMDLARCSDLVTDSMSALGDVAGELPDYLDVVAKSQNKSNQSAEQLMEAYLNVGGTMKDLGVPIEESAAALGVMANRGRKGGEAGQALSAIMANLTTGTGQAGKMMQKLGISAFDSEGNFIGLQNTLKTVNEATKNLSDEERNAALAALGGKQHVKDLNKLLDGLNATNKEGVSEWDALTGQLNNCNRALEKMAGTKIDNLEGDMAILESATQDFGISVYKNMQEPLRGLAQYGTQQMGVLSEALESGGFSGLASALGDVAADGLVQIADHAPEFIEMASTLVDSLISGIENNEDAIGDSLEKLAVSGAGAFVRLMPRVIVVGGKMTAAIAQGIIDHLPQLGAAAKEAVAYLMDEAKAAFAGYVDFLGDDSVKPFEKILALIPAVAAGFLAFGGISGVVKKVQGLLSVFKGFQSGARGFEGASTKMSAAAKNIAGVGAGLGLAAAGIWLLADAAIRIANAGPAAQIGLAAMVGGIAVLMVLAAGIGSKMRSAGQGMIAFGQSILMISAAMAIMAFSAVQLAQAGPAALVGLALMEGGMIALAVIAQSFGKKLTNAAPGLLAFGGAILMAAAGMSLLAFASVQLAQQGTAAIATMAGMGVGLIAFMAVAALLGPALTAAAVGLVAFGAGILLAGTGMLIMTQAALQLAAAGPTAQIAMAALAVGILAFGAVAGALAPLLMAGAAALAAFGAALVVVGAGMLVVNAAALVGAAALTIIAGVLPQLAAAGASGAVALMLLGASMTVFAAGAAVAGVASAAAAVGFAALAVAGAAAALAFAPLAIEMAAVAAAIAVIAASAETGAAGIKSLRESSSGMITSMAKLALAFAPVAAALVPFAAAAVAAAAGAAALGAAIALVGVSLLAVSAGIALVVAGITMANASMSAFRVQASMLNIASGLAISAFQRLSEAVGPMSSSLAAMAAPMTAAATGAMMMSVSIQAANQSIIGIVAATSVAAGGLEELDSGFVMFVSIATASTTAVVAVVRAGGAQIVAVAQSTVNSVRSALSVDLSSSGRNMMQGLVNGINSMRGPVEAAAKSVAQAAADSVNSALQIHSPSRVLVESGQYAGKGMAVGLESQKSNVAAAARSAISQPAQDAGAEARANRGSIIGDLVGSSGGGRGGAYAGGGQAAEYSFTYSPTYTIQGSASKDDIEQADRDGQAEFERRMKAFLRKNGRTKFA